MLDVTQTTIDNVEAKYLALNDCFNVIASSAL